MTSSNQILTLEDVLNEIDLTAIKVQSELKIKRFQAQILLQKFKWNVNSLLDAFKESPDRKTFLTENGAFLKRAAETNESEECSICCEDQRLMSLKCKHTTCQECWKSYLKEQIKNGHSLIECADYGCKLVIGPGNLERLLSCSHLEVLQKLTVKSYVDLHPELNFCPNTTCNKIIRKGQQDFVVCTCGTLVCLGCFSEAHFPATCQHLRDWKKECHQNRQLQDKASYDWLQTNTKECPRCSATIQRDGGCLQMRCKNKECDLPFCWNCLSPGYYHEHTCATRSGSGPKIRAKFTIFHICEQRFNGQQQNIEEVNAYFEREDVKTTVYERDAQNLILKCRTFLAHSYVFEYYRKLVGNYSKTFIALRDELNRATDRLENELLSEKQAFFYYRQDVHKRKIDAEQCLKAFMEHCAKEDNETAESLKNSLIEVLILCAGMLLIWVVDKRFH